MQSIFEPLHVNQDKILVFPLHYTTKTVGLLQPHLGYLSCMLVMLRTSRNKVSAENVYSKKKLLGGHSGML